MLDARGRYQTDDLQLIVVAACPDQDLHGEPALGFRKSRDGVREGESGTLRFGISATAGVPGHRLDLFRSDTELPAQVPAVCDTVSAAASFGGQLSHEQLQPWLERRDRRPGLGQANIGRQSQGTR